MIDFASYPLVVIFFVSLAAILVGSEIGRALGISASARVGASVSTLEGAMFGMLALIISFTFAMALTRYEARREAVLSEANSIATAALRARLLPAPHNTESLDLLREYARIRLENTQQQPSKPALDAVIARSNEIQEALWQQVKAIASQDSAMVPTGVFILALNEMIDNQEKRLTAMRNQVPSIVLLALYGMAILTAAFAGYAAGLDKQRRPVEQWRSRLSVYLMGVLVAALILLIQDLDRPGSGFITISQQPMIDAAATISGFAD
ncbi:MAG: hypothetical protein U1F33_02915 [Alphaproteobacteria bacterium]